MVGSNPGGPGGWSAPPTRITSSEFISKVGWALPTTVPRKPHHRFLTQITTKRLKDTGSNIAMKRWTRPITEAI